MSAGRHLRPASALASFVLILALAVAAPGVAAAAATASRPSTVDQAVPVNLRPTLSVAPRDYPKPYFDGCHVNEFGKPPTSSCVYGDAKSSTTIALFGDSHALAWFPAVEWIARHQGWRLVSLTMSACSPADIANWVPAWHRASTECVAWRQQAIARLQQERPALILVAGTRGFEVADASGNVLAGDARTQVWEAGMQRTLARLLPIAGHVAMIADTPVTRLDPPTCLAQHPASVLACATALSNALNPAWLAVEQLMADQAHIPLIDPSLWVCPSSPCPVVIGKVLVFRNPGHLTATFALTMARRLQAVIPWPTQQASV
jgi:hypothetical protein